jgi:hypothetical protein
MLTKFTNLTMGLVAVTTAVLAYDHWKARRELQQQAQKAAKATMMYIDNDLKILETNAQLSDDDPKKTTPDKLILAVHIKGKVEILLSPSYKLNLLGDPYVIKWPPKTGSDAWLLSRKDAEEMDKKIERIVLLYDPTCTNLSEQKRTVKECASTCLVNVATNALTPKE